MTGRLPARPWSARRPWTARRRGVVAAAIATGLLLAPLAAPWVVAPFTASVSNGTQTVSAGAWKSYVHTLQNDGTPSYWWRLGEASNNNTASAQTGGQNGTYNNGHGVQSPGAITGDGNTAATFNGTNQCLRFGDYFDTVAQTKFSVELWFRLTASHNGRTPRLAGKISGQGGWEIAINAPDAATNKNEIYFSRIDKYGNASYTGSGAPISTNTWYHVVATYNGSAMAFYLNGVQTGTTNTTGDVANNAEPVFVGCLGNSSQYFTGAIDEVALYYDLALTPRQVKSHYYAGLANGSS